MAELGYTLKCFFFTILLILCMQIKIGDTTIERMSYQWFHKSAITHFIQSTAEGAGKAMKDLYSATKSKVSQATRSFDSSNSARK